METAVSFFKANPFKIEWTFCVPLEGLEGFSLPFSTGNSLGVSRVTQTENFQTTCE